MPPELVWDHTSR